MVDILELKRLALAATRGPWTWSSMRLPEHVDDFEGRLGGFVAGNAVVMHFGADYAYDGMEGQPPSEADRRFIEAANPATVLALIQILEACDVAAVYAKT